MLSKETKNYVMNELLPNELNGYQLPHNLAVEVIDDIQYVGGNELLQPTVIAKNILANQNEFIAFVEKAAKEMDD